MPSSFNDSPVQDIQDDHYGINPFAKSLAKSIVGIKDPRGTTIALNGAWGSGKSSVVNLLRGELEALNEGTLVVSEFKCWWYKGDEALALAFLQNLNTILRVTLGDKVKGLIPSIGRNLLQAGKALGSTIALASPGIIGAATGTALDFAEKFFPQEDTLETTFNRLSEALEKADRRFLIIIDDIDRLGAEEAVAIFRLVKSVGRLPNVLYLLAFDRTLVDKAVNELYPSEGAHFLEKIVQASFEMPEPLQADLNVAISKAIEEGCSTDDYDNEKRLVTAFYDVIVRYITSPRDVVRFRNTISITWPMIADEVDLADFITLETLRLHEPELFQAIRTNRNKVCTLMSGVQPKSDKDDSLQELLDTVDEPRRATAETALKILFPLLRSVGYVGYERRWDEERLVCVDKHFDTYFRLTLSNASLSTTKIQQLTERADDVEFIKKTFLEAYSTARNTGSTMVPVFLDELMTHARRVDKSKVSHLISALFSIHDEISSPNDDEAFTNWFGNSTTLKYHWLLERLTEKRFSIDERTDLYLSAIECSSLGWTVDFVASLIDDYQSQEEDRQKKQREYRVKEEVLPMFVAKALAQIHEAAADLSLLRYANLSTILHRWKSFCNNDLSEVRQWTDLLIDKDEFVIVLAKAFTGYGLGQSVDISGINNYVVDKITQIQIYENTDVIDQIGFKDALERILSQKRLDQHSLDLVESFLRAWDNKKTKSSRL